MNELELYEKIEGYLKNRLQAPERERFEAELRADAGLKEQVELQREIMEATGEQDIFELRELMETSYARYRAQYPEALREQDSGPGERPGAILVDFTAWRRRMLAAAAAVLALAAVGLWWRMSQPETAPIAHTETREPVLEQAEPARPPAREEIAAAPPPPPQKPAPKKPKASPPPPRYIASADLAKRYYAEPPVSNIRSVSVPNSLTQYQRAALAFSRGDYEQVRQVLAAPDSASFLASLLLRAHSNFMLERYAEALADFQAAKTSDHRNFYSDQTSWHILLCELALKGARDPAVASQLDAIINDTGHAYHSPAARLLQEMKQE